MSPPRHSPADARPVPYPTPAILLGPTRTRGPTSAFTSPRSIIPMHTSPPSGLLPESQGVRSPCDSALADGHDSVQNEHQSPAVRLRTSQQSRTRALVRAFWQNFVINDDMNFNYLGIPQCSAANLAIALDGGA